MGCRTVYGSSSSTCGSAGDGATSHRQRSSMQFLAITGISRDMVVLSRRSFPARRSVYRSRCRYLTVSIAESVACFSATYVPQWRLPRSSVQHLKKVDRSPPAFLGGVWPPAASDRIRQTRDTTIRNSVSDGPSSGRSFPGRAVTFRDETVEADQCRRVQETEDVARAHGLVAPAGALEEETRQREQIEHDLRAEHARVEPRAGRQHHVEPEQQEHAEWRDEPHAFVGYRLKPDRISDRVQDPGRSREQLKIPRDGAHLSNELLPPRL